MYKRQSPWVLEAQTEEQQKERIATLFDLNNIRNNNIAALTRLQAVSYTHLDVYKRQKFHFHRVFFGNEIFFGAAVVGKLFFSSFQ